MTSWKGTLNVCFEDVRFLRQTAFYGLVQGLKSQDFISSTLHLGHNHKAVRRELTFKKPLCGLETEGPSITTASYLILSLLVTA